MKKILFLTSFLLIIAATTFMGCESSAQKKGFVQRTMNEVSPSVDGENDSTLKMEIYVSTEEWNTFKNNTDEIIKANKELIEDLKYGKIKTGKRSEMIFEQWIYILEQKNAKLEDRVLAYPLNPGDWESFKNEICSDFEKLEEELNNLVAKKDA
jgi:hypothetical protein